jgi:hypothetical protein
VKDRDAGSTEAANEETRGEYEAPTASEIEVTGGTIETAPVVGISCHR